MDIFTCRIYTQLELASTTKAAALERTHTGKPSTSEPQISDAPHLAFRKRYEAAETHTERRAVIGAALEELKRIRYSRHPKVDRETLEGRLKIARDTRPVPRVADTYGISPATVYRYRAEAKEHERKAS